MGWVQVGIDIQPAIALPALIQCFDDSLRRFGEVEFSGLQVTARHLQPDREPPIPHLGWFHESLGPKAEGLIAWDNGMLEQQSAVEFLEALQGWNGAGVPWGRFEFGSATSVSPTQAIRDPATGSPLAKDMLSPAAWGVPVHLPEWTPSSIAWGLAWVIAMARRNETAAPNFAVRITRVD